MNVRPQTKRVARSVFIQSFLDVVFRLSKTAFIPCQTPQWLICYRLFRRTAALGSVHWAEIKVLRDRFMVTAWEFYRCWSMEKIDHAGLPRKSRRAGGSLG